MIGASFMERNFMIRNNLLGIISVIIAVTNSFGFTNKSSYHVVEEVKSESLKVNQGLGELLFDFMTVEGESRKIEIINQIAELKTPEAEKVLKEYLRSFYTSEVSQNNKLKAATLKALLQVLDDSSRKRATVELFRAELDIIQKQKTNNYNHGNEVLLVLVSTFDRDGLPADIAKQMSSLSGDESLSVDLRTHLKHSIVKREMDGMEANEEIKIQLMLDKIPIRVYVVVPWDIYNYKAKRISYNNKEQLDKVGHFFKAEDGYILYNAYFSELLRYRLKSIEQILFALDSHKYQGERNDFLVYLGVELLTSLKRAGNEDQDYEKAIALLHRLEEYVKTMKDEGAGSHRNNSIRALYSFYKHEGLTNPPVFKEGGDVFGTVARSGEDAPEITNIFSRTELKTERVKSEVSTINRWRSVGIAISLVVGVCALLLFRLRK